MKQSKTLKSKFTNQSGYATVEISVLIWILLFIVFSMFYYMSSEFERVAMLSKLDEYTIDKSVKTNKEQSASITMTPSTLGVELKNDMQDDFTTKLISNVNNKKVSLSVHSMMMIHRQLQNLNSENIAN